MSRIVRGRIAPGDPLTSGDLNDRFADYNQPGQLNADNTRDGAFDMPHLSSDLILKNEASVNLGTGDWTRSTVNTVPAQNLPSAPAVKFPVRDGGGTETRLGPLGWTIEAYDVLRVYWNLTVEPKYQGTPWSGSPAELTFSVRSADTPPSTVVMSIGGHCWVLSLEWDITSASLSNFVPVFGGTDFTSTVDVYKGGALVDCRHASVVPAWRLSSLNAQNGKMPGAGNTHNKVGWYGASGAFYYAPTTPGVTVYGIRLVIHGVYHPAQATGSNNYLLVDHTVASGTSLDYSTGFMTALWQRTR